MIFQIELHPEAVKELTDSFTWYEERSIGLGLRFIKFVDQRLMEIAENPDRYPKRKGNFRETSIAVFPYNIVYEVLNRKKLIYVYCIFHTKRSQKFKYKRQ
jgi:mRNA-degrading endonuclease RelE of RelBE toxin-antitoxin system